MVYGLMNPYLFYEYLYVTIFLLSARQKNIVKDRMCDIVYIGSIIIFAPLFYSNLQFVSSLFFNLDILFTTFLKKIVILVSLFFN